MSINKVNLKKLNEENIYSSVDFQIADTNIYIELKHRRTKSNSYQSLIFDKKRLIFGTTHQYYQNPLFILLFLLKMIKITLSSITKTYLIHLKQIILRRGIQRII